MTEMLGCGVILQDAIVMTADRVCKLPSAQTSEPLTSLLTPLNAVRYALALEDWKHSLSSQTLVLHSPALLSSAYYNSVGEISDESRVARASCWW
jgi:hypothetical protein